MYNKPVTELSRWRISGVLTTLSSLHIGDGDWLPLADGDRYLAGKHDGEAKYASVHMDVAGKPILPATALKGVWRAWAEQHGMDRAMVTALFGTAEEKVGRRGRLTIHDGRWKGSPVPANAKQRCWSAARGTILVPQVKLDPRTRSAAEHLLYSTEVVPEGTRFSFSVSAQNATEEERKAILWVLQRAFSSLVGPCRLGSQMANGYGRMGCKGVDFGVEVMGREEIEKWLADPVCSWTKGVRALDRAELAQWLEGSARTTAATEERLELELVLRFPGFVLVNDPSQARKGEVGAAAIRRVDGTHYLPASSVRGALRGQFRRIWQTLAQGSESENLDSQLPEREGVSRDGGEKQLAAFYRMVGAGGWRSPISVSDFEPVEGTVPEVVRQEFVAIDRVTGGAEDEKKFSADGLYAPEFKGAISIDLKRWKHVGVEDWGWLLLAFVLRDWAEGDGFLGGGRAKGYGAFRAEVAGGGLLGALVRRERGALDGKELDEWERALTALLKRKEAA